MGWILLESLVALLILVGIVAWTMAPWRRRRGALPPPDEPPRGPDRDPGS
ncbi:MAG: hypothetical protein IT520_13970 [Burkholderiales bacterium]|nr:hypothetical protein [Burkholderiales bacterium]